MKKSNLALVASSLLLASSAFAETSIHTTVFKTNSSTPISVQTSFSAGTLTPDGQCSFTITHQPLPTEQISNPTFVTLDGAAIDTLLGPGYECMQMQFTSQGKQQTEVFKLFSADKKYVSTWPATSEITINV